MCTAAYVIIPKTESRLHLAMKSISTLFNCCHSPEMHLCLNSCTMTEASSEGRSILNRSSGIDCRNKIILLRIKSVYFHSNKLFYEKEKEFYYLNFLFFSVS